MDFATENAAEKYVYLFENIHVTIVYLVIINDVNINFLSSKLGNTYLFNIVPT